MILDAFGLSGRVAIVTGAGRGIGRAAALALAEAGADLFLVGKTATVEETRWEAEKMGRRASALQADLSRMKEIRRAMEGALGAYGRVDILVNNAGIIRRAPAIEMTEEDWDEVVGLNARSVFFLAQAAARDMVRRKKGKIINVVSITCFSGGVNIAGYAASKGAVAQMTKAMCNEWAREGINVNGLVPGYIATDINKELRDDPARFTELSARIPAGRWGTPEDLKGAFVFLASDASDYVNGSLLVVDGGWMAR